MKLRLLPLTLTMATLLTSAANATLDDDVGFSATISLNAALGSERNQMNTDDDNRTTASLSSEAKEIDGLGLFPLGRLNYTFNDGYSQMYVGNSENDVVEGDFKAEIGFVHQFADETTLTLGYVPFMPFAKSDVWRDPYVAGSPRQTSEQDSQGARIRVDDLLGMPIALEYGAAQVDIDNEQSGSGLGLNAEQRAKLDRNGNYHRVTAEVSFPVSQFLFITPQAVYTRGDLDGAAMAYDEYQGKLSFFTRPFGHNIALTLGYGERDYDESHPVFNRVRNDEELSAFMFYSYAEPFGLANTTFTSFGGYSESDSNIDFFDKEEFGLGIGMAYHFR